MAKKSKAESMNKLSESKTYALLGVLLTIIGFIIVMLSKKEDKYAMYYAKQGLVLFIAWVIAGVIMIVPVIGWVVGWILEVLLIILWIMGIIYSLSGEMKAIPIIGNFAEKLSL